MKSVLFVCNTMGQAGAEMAMMAMMAAMHRDGWQIDLLPVIPQGEMYGILPEYVRILGRPGDPESVHTQKGRKKMTRLVLGALLRRGWGRAGYLVKSLRLQQKSGRIKPQVLLYRVMADAAPRLDKRYDAAIAYLEGAATYYTADYVNAPVKAAFVHTDMVKAGYLPCLDLKSYEKMDRIFVVSNAAMAEFRKQYPALSEKTRLFRNMLDPDRIRLLKDQGTGFDDDFQGLRLLSVGRLMKEKAYDVALEAAAVMKKRGLPVRWYVIGTGDQKEDLLRRRDALGLQDSFRFLGAMTNPYPYVARCDIFMQTTRWEGRSIALFEAQALCRPIIVSDCPGNLEQITDGVNGLVTALDPEKIADSVETLVKDPRKRAALSAYLQKADVASDHDLPLFYELL